MNELLAKAGWWWLGTAAGGGAVLLLAGFWMRRVGSPAAKQRLGEWGVLTVLLVAALRLGPAWLPLPEWASAVSPETPMVDDPEPTYVWSTDSAGELESQPVAAAAPEPIVVSPRASWQLPVGFLDGLVIAYLGCAGFFGLRWLIGQWGLARLVRSASPVPPLVQRLFDDMVSTTGHEIRLLASPRVAVPICCGLRHPTVVIPHALAQSGDTVVLRWVFAHELTHLARRDPWSSWVLGLAQAVYFYVPWFWWVKRQVRLCQEYVADAAAAAQGPWADDYAQFLVSFARSPAAPLGATGVFGNRSDLYRRVSMVLNPSTTGTRGTSRGRVITGAGCLVAAGLVFAGIGVRAEPLQEKKSDDVKVEGKVIILVDGDEKDGDKKSKDDKGEKKEAQKRVIMHQVPGGDMLHGFDHAALEKKLREALKKAEMSNEQIDKIIKEVHKGLEMKVQAIHGVPGGVGGGGGIGGAPGIALWEAHPGGHVVAGQPLKIAMSGAQGAGGGGRFGIMVEPVSGVLAAQLELPKGSGLAIVGVTKGSAAETAGVKANDILLKFAGKDVKSDTGSFIKAIEAISADKEVDAVLLRKGKKEVVSGIKLPEAKKEGSSKPEGSKFEFKIADPSTKAVMVPKEIKIAGTFGDKPEKKESSKQVTVTIKDGDFSAKETEGDLTITVTGKVDGEKVAVKSVQIEEPGAKSSYSSLDKVPAKYKARVEKLIANQSGSAVRFRSKKDD